MKSDHRIVAYFDFDGTLTTKDTLIPFLIFLVGWCKFLANLPHLLFIVLRYYLRLITNEQAKEETLTLLVFGMKEYLIEHRAKSFALTKLNKYIKPEVYSKIEWHREHGHKIVLVSANLAVYLRYWACFHKLDGVIATEVAVHRGRLTGKLLTPNCYGAEKVRRIHQYLKDEGLEFCYSYGYGNSAGDYELLEYCDEPFWVSGNCVEYWKGLH